MHLWYIQHFKKDAIIENTYSRSKSVLFQVYMDLLTIFKKSPVGGIYPYVYIYIYIYIYIYYIYIYIYLYIYII